MLYVHCLSLYLRNQKPYKISAWPTAIDVHMARIDTGFNYSQSLACWERAFKITYDLKIYSYVVTLYKTNTCTSTASSFRPAIAWKWRQNFFRNFGNFLPVVAAQRPEKHGTSSTLLWKTHPSQCIFWGLRSSRMLHSLCWCLFTGVSRQPIGPIFKDQIVEEEFRRVSLVCGLYLRRKCKGGDTWLLLSRVSVFGYIVLCTRDSTP